MENKQVLVCTCDNCSNEAGITIKRDEIIIKEKASQPSPAAPQPKQAKGTFTCMQCGNEADMIAYL
jgi:hypothetical protein